jgi:biopolymer transport protein ExbD
VLKLELPRADGQPSEAQSKALSILINAQGRYFVGDREVLRTDVESLKQTLRDVAGEDRERIVLIRADARTPWQAVITAYDALGQLGFRRIANATAPETAKTAGAAAQ